MIFGQTGRVGDLDVQWVHGRRRRGDPPGPPVQVHAYDEHTYLLRQNKSVHYEGPFLFLLFGNERAVLFDTGATADPRRFPLRSVVDGVIGRWLEAHPRENYRLVVAHTHAHGDHVAADGQFTHRPDTDLVGTGLAAVTAFFGFTDWPDQEVELDLGGRRLEVVGIPGHHETSIAVFDPWTGILLTGDTVYPGRLYVQDMPAFAASIERLTEFALCRPVRHVLGCHIEMTRTPGHEYPLGCRYQPDEPPLQLTTQQLVAVRDATRRASGRRGVHVHPDFVVVNLGGGRLGTLRTTVRMVVRGLRQRLLSR